MFVSGLPNYVSGSPIGLLSFEWNCDTLTPTPSRAGGLRGRSPVGRVLAKISVKICASFPNLHPHYMYIKCTRNTCTLYTSFFRSSYTQLVLPKCHNKTFICNNILYSDLMLSFCTFNFPWLSLSGNLLSGPGPSGSSRSRSTVHSRYSTAAVTKFHNMNDSFNFQLDRDTVVMVFDKILCWWELLTWYTPTDSFILERCLKHSVCKPRSRNPWEHAVVNGKFT